MFKTRIWRRHSAVEHRVIANAKIVDSILKLSIPSRGNLVFSCSRYDKTTCCIKFRHSSRIVLNSGGNRTLEWLNSMYSLHDSMRLRLKKNKGKTSNIYGLRQLSICLCYNVQNTLKTELAIVLTIRHHLCTYRFRVNRRLFWIYNELYEYCTYLNNIKAKSWSLIRIAL